MHKVHISQGKHVLLELTECLNYELLGIQIMKL